MIAAVGKCHPTEVEAALPSSNVREVLGDRVPDPKWGEAVKAVVALRPGSETSADELIAFARERIAGYKLPKSIDFVDALPRNATGKVTKHILRAPYWRDRQRNVN